MKYIYRKKEKGKKEKERKSHDVLVRHSYLSQHLLHVILRHHDAHLGALGLTPQLGAQAVHIQFAADEPRMRTDAIPLKRKRVR